MNRKSLKKSIHGNILIRRSLRKSINPMNIKANSNEYDTTLVMMNGRKNVEYSINGYAVQLVGGIYDVNLTAGKTHYLDDNDPTQVAIMYYKEHDFIAVATLIKAYLYVDAEDDPIDDDTVRLKIAVE